MAHFHGNVSGKHVHSDGSWSSAPAIVALVPTASGATVTYSGTATHYRVNGGAAVAVPSNPFTFTGLAPNSDPHTVELSGDGGSTWPAASAPFGTLNPGSGSGEPVTEVQQDQALVWNVSGAAQRDQALVWNVSGSAQRDQALAWNLLSAAARNQPLNWNLLTQAQRDTLVTWSILGSVNREQALLWDIQDAPLPPGTVIRNQVLTWGVLNTVQRDQLLAWGIASAVQRDQFVAWNVLTAAQREAILQWSINGTVTRNQVLTWNIEGDGIAPPLRIKIKIEPFFGITTKVVR